MADVPELAGSAGSAVFDDELPSRAEVVVVGGGIAGASTAWHLARAGVDVVLLERERVGGGATGAAVGVLSPPLRQPFHEVVHDLGESMARDVWSFAARSVEGLGETLRALGVEEETELDLSGGWVLAEGHSQHAVSRSYRALLDAGFDVEWQEGDAVRSRLGGRGFVGGFVLRPGGALRPSVAARALAAGGQVAGAQVVEGTAVEEVLQGEGGLVCRLTGDRRLGCEVVVHASHVDSRRFSDLLGEEIVPIRGQALALELLESFPSAGCFATHWKLNLWRRSALDPHRVILGGWRHDAWDRAYRKTDPEVDGQLQDDILAWFQATFPTLGPAEVTDRWSGIFGWTADYLPLVGNLPGSSRELVVGGFSGGGLPFAFESGRAIAHAVVGLEPVPGAEHFRPGRFV